MSRVPENLRTLEKLVELFNDHDLDGIMELFADDCSLDMPRGSAPWGTRYVGKAAVREGLRTRFEMLPDSPLWRRSSFCDRRHGRFRMARHRHACVRRCRKGAGLRPL